MEMIEAPRNSFYVSITLKLFFSKILSKYFGKPDIHFSFNLYFFNQLKSFKDFLQKLLQLFQIK